MARNLSTSISELIRFFQYVIKILTPSFVLVFFIEINSNNNSLQFAKKEILQYDTTHTIVLGSSHAANAIKCGPSGIHASNMAWPSQTLDESIALLNRIDSASIILTISPHTFCDMHDTRQESWKSSFFRRNFGTTIYDRLNSSIIAAIGGREATKLALHLENSKNRNSCDLHGNMQTHETTKINDASVGQVRWRHTRNPYQPELWDGFNSSLSGQSNILLVTTPFHPLYNAILQTDPQWISIVDAIQDLSRNTNNLSYINAADWDLPNNAFKDADHLNALGAQIFTEMLADSAGLAILN